MKNALQVLLLTILVMVAIPAFAADGCLKTKINKAGKPSLSIVTKNNRGLCPKGTIAQSSLADSSNIAFARIRELSTTSVISFGGSKATSASVVRTDTGQYEVTFQGDFSSVSSASASVVSRVGTSELADTIIVIPSIDVTPTSIKALVYSQFTSGAYRNGNFSIMLLEGQSPQ